MVKMKWSQGWKPDWKLSLFLFRKEKNWLFQSLAFDMSNQDNVLHVDVFTKNMAELS